MKEAGYEWDADKKELKKIEDEPENYKQQVMSEMTDLVKDYIHQNPAWSKEDERLWHSCIAHIEDELEQIRNDKYGHSEIISDNKESCRERIKWLKSIKERYIWKPTDEQMEALADALSLAKNCGEERAFDLRTLYEQLQKIKEDKL